MSTRTDPLSRSPEPRDRVAYATGVLLDAEDFEAEQLYHRARLARALAYLHGWGTVAGLFVTWERESAGAERLTVQPGLALDRVGRTIEVPRSVCLRLDRWYDQIAVQDPGALDRALDEPAGGVVADVFVRFAACERGFTPAFAQGPFDATDAVQPARLRDGYHVGLFLRTSGAAPLPAQDWPDPDVTPAAQDDFDTADGIDSTNDAETGADAAARALRRTQNAVFGLWSARESLWSGEGLAPLREHLPGQDPTSVFLARLLLPATRGAAGEAPVRDGAADVTIDNRSRRFALPVIALARRAGL